MSTTPLASRSIAWVDSRAGLCYACAQGVFEWGRRNLANFGRIMRDYPKTVETIARELSVYELRAKRDGIVMPDAMMDGIAMAIIDHILGAGEMS